MRVSTSLLFCLSTLTYSHYLQAAEVNGCGQLKTYREALDCALIRHPELGASKYAIDEASKGIDFASQRPNPELASQGIFGGSQSGNYVSAEMNFAHTFELGGKRKARIRSAEANVAAAQGDLTRISEEVYLRTALALRRVRQIRDEWDAIEDALQTFSRIGKQYRERPRLTPEQRASLRIFEIAAQDYKLRQVALESERELRLGEIEFALGQRLNVDSPALPGRRNVWPPLPNLVSPAGNARSIIAEGGLNRAEAGLEQAKAEAWPDVKVGPTLYEQHQSGQSFSALGLNFSLPLPIYHRNEAGKAMAAIAVDRAEQLKFVAERENELERKYLRHRYESAVASLKQTGNTKDLLKKHEETESLFSQGFLSGTVVVEIHRQISDFLKTQNEQELSAEEALIRYFALSGHTLEEGSNE